MKRAFWFLLLLGLGFLLLNVLVQDEPRVVKQPTKQDIQRPRPVEGSGIEVQNGGMNIVTQVSGPLKIGQVRLVPTGNGSRKELVYELSCSNTVPLADGTYRLEGVTVQLYDEGQHAADLHAKQAVVALNEDANGKRSIREDKDLEMTGAVLATLPGARIGELRIECGRLRARIADFELALDTPDDQEPVLVQVGGARAGLLRGRGLRARMPKDRGLADGKLDIVLLREPHIEANGLSADATGNLHYLEALATGSARLTLEQSVSLGLEGATGLTGARGATRILGDRLECTLHRTKSAAQKRDAVLWEQITLLGNPARVDSPGVALQSRKLTVTPGIDGKPAMLTAHGGPARLMQTDAHNTFTFTSDAPIRLLQPRSSIAAVHEAMGFPSWSMRPLRQMQILLFDGKSEIEATDGFRIQASSGLRVFQPQPNAVDGAILAHGLGEVLIEQGTDRDRTTARGNQGFLLTRSQGSDRLVLGSDGETASHSYQIVRGELELGGSGACELERLRDQSAHITLRSPAADIQGKFGRDLGTADHLEQLEATLVDRELTALHAAGPKAHFAFTRSIAVGDRIDAYASIVTKAGRASWSLAGSVAAPARIVRAASGREPAGELEAPRIDIHQLGLREVLIDATAQDEALARFRADHIATGNTESAAVITARRIRLLPFAIPTSARRAHFLGMPDSLVDRMEHVLGHAWVLAEERVTADISDLKHGATHGTGEQLVLSQGALAGMWTGNRVEQRAATIENTAVDGRRTTASGARVRFFRADGDRIDVLTDFVEGAVALAPRVVLRDTKSASGGPLSHLDAQCEGPIEVRPDAVLFRGAVQAHSLLADGSADPAGLRLHARTLAMARALDTGNVTVIDASGGVDVQWKDLRARSARVEIDLRRQRCTATDPEGAELLLGARRFQGRRIEANYVNYSVRTWFGGFSQVASPVDSR